VAAAKKQKNALEEAELVARPLLLRALASSGHIKKLEQSRFSLNICGTLSDKF
jgi:hypothetical protein